MNYNPFKVFYLNSIYLEILLKSVTIMKYHIIYQMIHILQIFNMIKDYMINDETVNLVLRPL